MSVEPPSLSPLAAGSSGPADHGLESQLQIANISRALFAEDRNPALGRFVVLERIGAGGMGTVFKAYDPTLDRSVALKVIRHNGQAMAAERIAREARSLARLNHPNVVAVYEVGEATEQTFVAMEFVQGVDLAEWIAANPTVGGVRFDRALGHMLAAGAGLAAAHDAGLVHRDFKPANVLIGTDGRTRVADFGLARAQGRGADEMSTESAPSLSSTDSGSLTKTGAVVGTPAYMAPEQRDGDEVTAASDQFSFCMTAWEAMFNVRPQRREADAASLPAGMGVRARHVARVLRRGLQQDPNARYPGIAALLQDLRRNPAVRRRRWLAAAAGATAIAGAVGLYLVERASRCSDAGGSATALWSDARQQEIAAAFDAVDWPMASDSWTRVRSNIDAYLASWTTQAEHACEAARLAGTLPVDDYEQQMQCLGDRLVRLEAVMEVLADADRELVVSAPVLTSALAPLGQCVKAPNPDTPLPVAPESLTHELARGLGLGDAGRHAEAALALESVADRARDSGAPIIEAKARIGLANSRAETDGPKVAIDIYTEAYWLALEHGDDTVAAGAARGLAASLAPTPDLDEAEKWARYAQVLGKRSSDGPAAASVLASSLGRIAFERGNLAESVGHMRDSLRLAIEAWGDDHPNIVAAKQNLAAMLRVKGELPEALELVRDGHEIRVTHFGPHHPAVGHSTTNLAQALGRMGRHPEAIAAFDDAVKIFAGVYGREHIFVAQTLTNLGVSQTAVGDHAAAEASHREAMRIYEGELEPGDTRLLTAKMNLAATQTHNGRCTDALPHIEHVVTTISARTPDHPRLAVARSIFGACLIRARRFDDAITQLRAADKAMASRPSDAANVRTYIALAQQEHGDLEAAHATATEVVGTLSEAPQARSGYAEALRRLASIELARGETEAALRHSAQALSVAREALKGRPGLIEALAQRAQVQHGAGQPEQAEEVAREAVALVVADPEIPPPLGASAYLALAEATAASAPDDSKVAAREALQWLGRLDDTFATQAARARELAGTP